MSWLHKTFTLTIAQEKLILSRKEWVSTYMIKISRVILTIILTAQFRAKASHMEKFPKDVSRAEEMTGGNVNILSDPVFIPERRADILAEVFGTPSPKKKKIKDSDRKKSRSSLSSIVN